jgi:hypothetical protein
MTNRPSRPVRKTLCLALAVGFFACIFSGCAEIGPPPGGEADHSAPTLVTSIPAEGALGVPEGTEIMLQFSEPLVSPDKGKGVFVSPRPLVEPNIKWKSDRILITLAEPFQPDQTYIVTVSSDVADQRRNRLDATARIAFSTGDQIDTGFVAGRISTVEGKPAAGWTVGLFSHREAGDFLGSDTIYPGYLATTNQEGRFDFHYLPDGEYSLLGFDDRNRNELFGAAHESYAIPDRPVAVGGELPLDDLTLLSTKLDTLAPEIVSAAGTGDGLIGIRLSKPIVMARLADDPARVKLVSVADESVSFGAAGLAEPEDEETSALTACFSGLAEGVYRLTLDYDAEAQPLEYDSLRFRPMPDKSAPSIDIFEPGQRPMFVNEVEIGLTFSEPLDRRRITEGSFLLWEDSLRVIDLTESWLDCFRLRLDPAELLPGHVYRLDITEFNLADPAGNLLGDSLRSYKFSTLDGDSLGSIGGRLFIDLPSKQSALATLVFRNVETQREFRSDLAVPDRSLGQVGLKSVRDFTLDVPPGEYVLSGFLDANRDGRLTAGSLQPYRLSETEALYGDTINVRARFETAGIEFRFE